MQWKPGMARTTTNARLSMPFSSVVIVSLFLSFCLSVCVSCHINPHYFHHSSKLFIFISVLAMVFAHIYKLHSAMVFVWFSVGCYFWNCLEKYDKLKRSLQIAPLSLSRLTLIRQCIFQLIFSCRANQNFYASFTLNRISSICPQFNLFLSAFRCNGFETMIDLHQRWMPPMKHIHHLFDMRGTNWYFGSNNGSFKTYTWPSFKYTIIIQNFTCDWIQRNNLEENQRKGTFLKKSNA